MMLNQNNHPATAEEIAAAYALYQMEVKGAEQESIETTWQTEARTRDVYLDRAQTVIKTWVYKAGECAVHGEITEDHILPEQRACIDMLAACQGHSIEHICCALIVAAVDKIATENQNAAQKTLLSYLNFNAAMIDAQHAILNELYEAEGIQNPVQKMNGDDLIKEFLA